MSVPVMADFREALVMETVERVSKYADLIPDSESPCYIIVAAKPDKNKPGKINATMQHYLERPPVIIGLLVWYVDKQKGLLEFVPELSLPPDIPLEEKHVSKDSKDSFARISEVGSRAGIILS